MLLNERTRKRRSRKKTQREREGERESQSASQPASQTPGVLHNIATIVTGVDLFKANMYTQRSKRVLL